MKKGKHHGPSLNAVLKEEGLFDELHDIVAKEAVVWQLLQAMKKRKISKVKMAQAMNTSRAQLDRILDPKSGNVTIETLQRAAAVVGKSLKLELV